MTDGLHRHADRYRVRRPPVVRVQARNSIAYSAQSSRDPVLSAGPSPSSNSGVSAGDVWTTALPAGGHRFDPGWLHATNSLLPSGCAYRRDRALNLRITTG